MMEIFNLKKERVAILIDLPTGERLPEISEVALDLEVNGIPVLEFILPKNSDKWQYIQPEYYILYQGKEFIIKQPTERRSSDGRLISNIQAELNAVELLDHDNELIDLIEEPVGIGVNSILVGNSSGWTAGTIQGDRFRSLKSEEQNALYNLQEWRRLHGGFLDFDSINKKVNIFANIGEDKGIQIRYAKNMIEIEKSVDSRDLCTYLIPFGKDKLDVSGVHPQGLKYVENYDWYIAQGFTLAEARAKFKKIRRWNDSNYQDAQALYNDALLKAVELSQPRVAYRVSVVYLAMLAGYEHETFGLGDLVWIYDEEMGIEVKVRIMRMRLYPQEPWRTEVELANIEPNFHDMLAEVARSSSIMSNNADKWDRSIEAGRVYNFGYVDPDEGLVVIDGNGRVRVHVGQIAPNVFGLELQNEAGTRTILDQTGMLQAYMIQEADNVENNYPLVLKYYVPETVQRIDKVLLNFSREAFRAYSKSALAGGGSSPTSGEGGGGLITTPAGGGDLATSEDDIWSLYGATIPDVMTFAGSHDHGDTGSYAHNHGISGGTRLLIAGGGDVGWIENSHYHSISSDGGHAHDLDAHHHHDVTIPNHVHNFNLPTHAHTVTLPDHSHGIAYGIWVDQTKTPTDIKIKVDGTDRTVALGGGTGTGFNNDQANLDLTQYVSGSGWHTVEISSTTLGRINASLYVEAKIST